jgi:hypothetical protein
LGKGESWLQIKLKPLTPSCSNPPTFSSILSVYELFVVWASDTYSIIFTTNSTTQHKYSFTMPSLRTTVLAVAASCVAVVNADYYIEPDSVPISQRRVWCQNTKEACPLICEQTSKGEPKVNSCDPVSVILFMLALARYGLTQPSRKPSPTAAFAATTSNPTCRSTP